MKAYPAMFLTLLTVFSTKAYGQYSTGQQLPMTHMSGLLSLAETIPLPGDGYMDHLAVDVKGQRLFISGEAARSLITGDLREGKLIHETKGLANMPKKSFYFPDTNQVWLELANSSVVVISGTTYEAIKTVKLSGFGDPKGGRTTGDTILSPTCFTLALKSSKTLVAAAIMDPTMLPLISWTQKPPHWWEASSCQEATLRASPSNHRVKDCMSPWATLSEVRVTLRSWTWKNEP